MAEKDIDGHYRLKFNIEDNTCSQCDQPIEDGEDIFVDAEGVFRKSMGFIKIRNVCIYHYRCIVDVNANF